LESFRIALSDLRAPVTRLMSRPVARLTAALWLATVLVASPGGVAAQPPAKADRPADHESSPPSNNESTADNAATDAPADDPRDPAVLHRKEGMATVAVLLLAGIAAIGVATIGMIVIWGFRVRRTIREPLQKTAKPDELWYLRAKAGLPRDKTPRTEGDAGASDSTPPAPADAP
jgi:hypothetical protein